MSRLKRPFIAVMLALSLCLAVAPAAHADDYAAVNQPSELAVLGDMLIARPALVVVTAVGSVLYLVTLPFSALGGNDDEMAEMLVRKPARAAFLRCLGCTPAQNRSRDIENQQQQSLDSNQQHK